MHKLKKARIIISSAVFILFVFVFLGAGIKIQAFYETLTFFQLLPSFLKFIFTGFSLAGAGFILIMALTFFFGRVYCSTLCPLGTLMDIFIYLKYRFAKRKFFKPQKNHRWFRYPFAGAVFLFFIFGSMFLLNVHEPYANFGRVMGGLAKPLFESANNLLYRGFSALDLYIIKPVEIHLPEPAIIIHSLIFLVFLFTVSLLKGRFYCNTLCPAGAVLGLISRVSVFRIQIKKGSCNSCGLCSSVCKAGCIDCSTAAVDTERCVGCFNCLDTCRNSNIFYGPVKKEKEYDEKRRGAVSMLVSAGAALGALLLPAKVFAQKQEIKKELPVIPPGSKSLDHFNSSCIGCHLCVSACPTKVLQPTMFGHGLKGILQPVMDYSKSYCLYDCVECSDVCPTGAILPILPDEKKRVQIGKVSLIKENCYGWVDLVSCNICDEYCPTKAVKSRPHPEKRNIFVPYIDPDKCIGCGACENVCPASPKAIYVDGVTVHGEAKSPGGGRQRNRGGRGRRRRSERPAEKSAAPASKSAMPAQESSAPPSAAEEEFPF